MIAADLGLSMTELSLAWLLHQRGVASVLVGARSPAQVRQNARAAAVSLSADVLAKLGALTDALKQRFGLNPDMWQSTSRYR